MNDDDSNFRERFDTLATYVVRAILALASATWYDSAALLLTAQRKRRLLEAGGVVATRIVRRQGERLSNDGSRSGVGAHWHRRTRVF
jgi:hypothetical protein